MIDQLGIQTELGISIYHSQCEKWALKIFSIGLCGGPLIVEAPGQLPSLPTPKSGPVCVYELLVKGQNFFN